MGAVFLLRCVEFFRKGERLPGIVGFLLQDGTYGRS
jgi:hypothetical protein